MASAWSQLDQLLTCAICLDRYRNPKLLPCQHTFCMEPCLDGLIDYGRRQIKCPECRAEHRIPYQGIQQFPTNVTLMRFLELHRDITGEEPEPPPSMMERCSVCSEKSNVEKCAHCDKKICNDCKEAHVDILRREINRINNQVRRGLHRLSEALTQTKKNAEKLQYNCTQVKDEIEDIVKRYSKDLKVTEEKLKQDLEMYTKSEMKSVNKLREDLEVEVNNISSNCDLVEKYITDDYEWSDVELLEYKQIFIKMLDFLRTFDPDNSDFSRRIKFQPRADPDVLHRNIADFGELKINAPVNAVPTQQSLMPPSNALMRSQSDHRLAAQFARRGDNRSFSDINQRLDTERDSDRPTSPLLSRRRREEGYRRYSDRNRDYDYQDRISSRYGRDDTALSSRWRDGDDHGHRNRYGRDCDEGEYEPHQGRTVRFADEANVRESVFGIDEASKGPLSGVFKLIDSPKVMERLHQNEVKQKILKTEKEKDKPSSPVTPAPLATTQPKRAPTKQASEDDIDRQKKANQQASTSTSSNTTVDATPKTLPQKTPSQDSPRRQSVSEPPRTAETTETPDPTTPARPKPTATTSLDEPPAEAPRNTSTTRQVSSPDVEIDPKETLVGDSKDSLGPQEDPKPRRHAYTRHRSDTRYDRPLAGLQNHEENKEEAVRPSSLLIPGRPDVSGRRFTLDDITGQDRPNYTRFRNNEVSRSVDVGRSPTARYSPLYRRAVALPTISALEPTSNDDDCSSPDSTNMYFSCSSSLEDVTGLFPKAPLGRFSRSPLVKAASIDGGETSRKPLDKKASPRAATPVRQNVVEEDSSESEEDDDNETFETAQEPPKPVQSSFFTRQRRLPEPEPRLLEMHSSESEEEEESESEEEESEDDEEEEVGQATIAHPETPSVTRQDEDDEEEDDDDEEEDEESESSESESDSAKSEEHPLTSPSSGVVSSAPSDTTDAHISNETRSDLAFQQDQDESDDQDFADNQSESEDDSDDHKHSTPPDHRRTSQDAEVPTGRTRLGSDNSSSGSSTSKPHQGADEREPSDTSTRAASGRFRSRPFLARSKSSHELGLGYDAEDLDQDEDCDPPAPAYRTRPERKSEDFSRTVARQTSLDAYSGNSGGNNSCWANYLKSKYGSNATGRVVPRSRSSHSLYNRSEDETSDDDVPSGRDPVLPGGTYSFANPRSTYMQKRRMMLKIGSRGTETGQFTWPRGVAVGPENSIAVSDSSNHRIQVFDSIGKFLFEFGSYGSGDGEFDCPAGVSVNRIGQLIVSDRYNHRVQLFDPTGRFLRAFGCEGRTDGRFNYPWGIATDSLGFIYVCDKENHRVQVFQSDGTFVGKFGAQGCRPGQLEHPHYVAVTSTNRVVVTDTNNHRVQVFDVNGRSLASFGSEGSSEGQFKFPKGVAVDDQGFIVVADSGNNRIQVFQPDGTFLRCFGAWGAGNGEFKGLEGIAVTSGGRIIACDRENHRIQVF